MEPPKPAMEECIHCTGRSCAIYNTRPEPCRGFECAWLCSQRWPDRALPKGERPDRTGIVMEVNSKGTVIVHCQTPEAWARPVNRKRLMDFCSRGITVTIEHGDSRVSVLERDGTLTALRYLDTADNGERRYVRPTSRKFT